MARYLQLRMPKKAKKWKSPRSSGKITKESRKSKNVSGWLAGSVRKQKIKAETSA